MMSELVSAWGGGLSRLWPKAKEEYLPAKAPAAFIAPVTPEELAAGLRWSAQKESATKTWEWAGLR